MDLFLVSLLLQSVLLLPFVFLEAQADQDPINKYSEYLNSKDVKEDMKRRRKHVRVQPISLKPPPQDWPEPQLAAGDFIVTGQSEATSLSPLLAYQAKLEKEYEKQRKEKMKKELNIEKSDSDKIASTFTSSDEDLHKLLDPNELLKHNKQLRPFVNPSKSAGDQVNEKQGTEAKPAGISSLTALKAKSAARKNKKRPKSSQFTITTTLKPRKGRRRKITQVKESETDVLSEQQKRKKSISDPSNSESSKTKQMKKRTRGFTFAERKYEQNEKPTIRGISLEYTTPEISWNTGTLEYTTPEISWKTGTLEYTTPEISTNTGTTLPEKEIENITYPSSTIQKVEESTTITSYKIFESKKETGLKFSLTASPISKYPVPMEDSLKKSDFVCAVSEVTTETRSEIQKVTYPTSTTTKPEVQVYIETTSSPDKTTTSKNETAVEYTSTTSSIINSIETNANLYKKAEMVSTTPQVIETIGTSTIKFDTTTNEITKKRKEIKQEMEKVLEAEELDGSFTDTDSNWTTSETNKVPIHLVTPRHALMGILKHKVINVIDKILKESPKPTEDQILKYEEKYRRIPITLNNSTVA